RLADARLALGDDERLPQLVDEDVRRILSSHPLRFSFPCRFAYRSPTPNTQRPSGIEAAPITSSGQSSGQTSPTLAPLRIACLIPRRAYVAGEIREIACIQPGSTETG